jgi:hypothetical protein
LLFWCLTSEYEERLRLLDIANGYRASAVRLEARSRGRLEAQRAFPVEGLCRPDAADRRRKG